MRKRKRGLESQWNHNTAPPLGQISPDLSVYQNPVSELYVKPSRHHRVPWLTEPQFPHRLAAFQSTRPSQSLTTEGLVQPQKGNSLSLSFLCAVTGSGSSCTSIGDSSDPSSTLIRFSGVPRMGTGGGDGDWNGGRISRGSGEASRAHLLWFFLKCIQSHCDFFAVRTSSNSIVAFAFCFCILCSICHIVEWMWSIVNIFWKAIHPSNSSLKFSPESKIVSRDSRFRVSRGCNT